MTYTIEQLEKRLAAATPGPWSIAFCESAGHRCTNYYQEIWGGELDILVTTEVTRAHNDGGDANMRLIVSAPTLAAELIAAKKRIEQLEAALVEAADVADAWYRHSGKGTPGENIRAIAKAKGIEP